MEAQLLVKTVYGTPRIYPANDIALKFCALLNCKTLSIEQVKIINELGFKVTQLDGFLLLNIETKISKKVS